MWRDCESNMCCLAVQNIMQTKYVDYVLHANKFVMTSSNYSTFSSLYTTMKSAIIIFVTLCSRQVDGIAA